MGVLMRCLTCGKEFISPLVTKPQRYCSRTCYTSTLKGKPKSEAGRKNIAKANKLKVNFFGAWARFIRENPDHPKVIAWKKKITERQANEKHFMWKGNRASYRTIHQWLERHYIKKGICEHCGLHTKTDWANKTGNYERLIRDDWIELCRSCHKAYDFKYKIKNPKAQTAFC